ncbi:hypothetical protein UFOVP901_61 [uncultured Caudovirales phage]|uniref:Uncharacterized protein n=1 Tax=uncultured Caudovirales phage TaxID=2100421 RepID=A0A6J5PGG8_9CAUD|nr:hypothetical protein UFOVP901_61 [uncultured Caudovirales phage]
MKLDLDEMDASLGYLDDWKQLIKELRAAREMLDWNKAVITAYGEGQERLCMELKAAREVCDEARKLLKDWVGNGYPLALGIALDKARRG